MSIQRRAAVLVGRPAFWALFVGILFAWPIARSVRARLPPPLPVLGTVPDFELRDQHDRPFGAAELRGKVWVANFIFTRCPTVCPGFTKKMAEIQHRARNLGPAIHLVSFSVDPDFDQPAVLAQYAQANHAVPFTWSFLTGSPEAVKRTVVDGLKVAMGRDKGAGATPDDFASIFHGSYFVLVDARLRIRGYYDSNQDDAVDSVLHDAGLLINRGT